MQDNWWASAPVVGATPAPVAQPRPQQQTAPRPRPAAPIAAAPVLNELGITNAQERDALMDQGYTAAQADAFLAQNSAAMPAPSAPIVQEAPSDAWWSEAPVEGQSSTGFELPEGVIDWNTLTDEQRRGLKRGARIMLPQREGETFRQVATLAADLNAPSREDLPGDVIQQYDGFRTREGQMADVVGAVASGAAEQVPGLDEAVTGLDALINRRSFSESRDEYRNMVEALNEQQRGARNVGGVLGFGGTMLMPGIGGANYVSQGLGRGSQIARAMQVGGLGGAVYGGTAAEGGFADRAQGAALGAALGAGTGAAVQGVAPLFGEGFRRLGGGFSEAGSVLSRGVGRVAPEADITPQDTINAQQYVARLLQSSGADLAGSPVAAMGKPITSAEVIGPSGIANMAALARRSGRAGNLTQAQLGARAIEQPNRVVQDFADLTGMDPAGSADMIQNLVTAGRARATPLYEAAYARPGAVLSPLIDDLLNRPATRDAMRRAVKIAANEGRDPNTLGFQFNDAGDVTHVQEPSMETLDLVKRGLDDVLNSYRDSTTRRLNLDSEGRSVQGIVRQFRDELVRLNPAYGEALSAGGDPLRLEEAFRLSDRLFQVGTPERTFRTATQGMGEAERNALVAGFADRLFRDAQAGRLSTRQLNQLNVPVTREKLASLIGAEGADSFMQRVGAEIELTRSGGRMAPGTNSVTAEALAAMAEQDGSTGFAADLARNMAQGRGNMIDALAITLGKAAVAPATGFVRGMTVSKPQAVRDEIARLLLLSPEELQAQLTAVAGSARPNADGLAKALRPAAGVGGGQVGAGFVQPDAQNARPANRRAAQ
jgi:hypothetical protein